MKYLTVPIGCGLLFVLQNPAGPLSAKVAFGISLMILGGFLFGFFPVILQAIVGVRHRSMVFLLATTAVLFFGRQCIEMAPSSLGSYLRALVTFGAFSLMALAAKDSRQAATWLGASVSVFAIFNFAGLAAGISSDYMASVGEHEGRMVFPFSGGMAPFPCVVGVGIAAAVVGLRISSGDHFSMMVNAGTIVICIIAVVLAGMRSTLMIGLLAFLLIDSRGMFVKLGVLLAFAAMCVLPMLYMNLWAIPTVEKLVPDFLHSYIERYSDELIFLNGRAYIYDYGFSLLGTRFFPVFGMGFDGRDSSPMLVGQLGLWEASGATSFHNGFLELLVINGIFLGLAATLVLGLALVTVLRDGKGITRASTASTVYGCIAAAPFLLSAMTAFVSESFFWGTLLFCLLAPRVTQSVSSKTRGLGQIALRDQGLSLEGQT